jgi:malonyl CoA-acyl carrier protein transacylase/NAD(P)-dependent dehydrogenase (short-subunit alcohol dehydrogenase family)
MRGDRRRAGWCWSTGGARGITAEICRELAQPGVHLIIAGRATLGGGEAPVATDDATLETDLATLRSQLIAALRAQGVERTPAEIESEARALQREHERRRNLAAFAAAGAEVEYHAIDVRTESAFGALIDDLYRRFGRIDAVVHGAGIIEDRQIEEKSVASFDRVFDTKADSAFILGQHLRAAGLRWVVFFSSVAGRFGNQGQVDYAAANEVVNRLACQFDAQWPATRVAAINWGPWRGAGMASQGIQRQFVAKGITPIEAADGVRFFVDELTYGQKGEVEVIAGEGPWKVEADQQLSTIWNWARSFWAAPVERSWLNTHGRQVRRRTAGAGSRCCSSPRPTGRRCWNRSTRSWRTRRRRCRCPAPRSQTRRAWPSPRRRRNSAPRLTLARSRLAALARPRLTIRNSGVYLGLDAAPPTPRRIAFLFPGQGSQHVGMLHELYRRTPTVRGWLDALDAAYASVGRPRPSELIYGEEAQEAAAPAAALFSMEQGAQLSTVANLALYELMGQLGIHGDALVGHSIGEHAAVLAAHAGHAAHRAAICAELCQLGRLSVGLEEPAIPEAMAAVSAFDRASLEALVARNPQQLFIAMDNCPHQQVLAGTRGAVDAALAAIVAAGGIGARLPFVRAYHTPLFGPRAEQLAAWYRRTGLTPAPLHGFAPPVYSCLTGQPIPTAPADAARVMAQQWVAPVNFRSTVERLYAAGIDAFVEVGPDAKLTAFVEDILRGRPHLAVSMLGPAQATPRDLAQIGHMLAALFAHGAAVDTARYGRCVRGRLGDWEIGRLGDWRLGDWRLEIGGWPISNLQSLNPLIPQSHPPLRSPSTET